MLPLGIGPFQNDAPLLGATLMGTQLAGLSISIASFVAVENLRGADGRFRNADVEQARSFQNIQMVSGGIAITIAVLGIVEAMLNFTPRKSLGSRERQGTTPNLGLSPAGSASILVGNREESSPDLL